MNGRSGSINRREMLQAAAMLAGGAGAFGGVTAQAGELRQIKRPEKCTPCLFSKPLHNRSVAELAAVLGEAGISGVDLTCRPGGHVLPERVREDLPKAIETLKAAGVAVPMLTTGITDADQGEAAAIIRTAGELGIGYIKLGYYPYKDIRKVMPAITDAQQRIKDVIALCKEHKVHAGYHNHCGRNIGAAMWDGWHLLLGTSAIDAGFYFDLRHATVEGGDAGWQIGLNMLAPRITMLALKDFIWKKDEKGRWRVEDVPLGQGMVRLTDGLKQVKELGIAGPVSLHVEYVNFKAPVGSDQDRKQLEDIRRDWQTMNAALQGARLV